MCVADEIMLLVSSWDRENVLVVIYLAVGTSVDKYRCGNFELMLIAEIKVRLVEPLFPLLALVEEIIHVLVMST